MAFYNRKMVKNKALIKAWKAGHQRKFDDGEEICVPEICEEIARWMRRDRRPRSRLSLRSFSILLSGTIRLYRDQVNLLLKDTLNYSLLKPVIPISSLGAEKQETSTSGKSFSLSNGDQSKLTENNSDSTNSSPENNSDEDMSDESTVFTVTPNNNQQDNVGEIHEKKIETRDQIIQTCSCSTPETVNIGNTSGFDPNLPFGYIIVHENFHSRIPSKILLSNLNKNVNFYPFSSQ